jgi:hypothetical protein
VARSLEGNWRKDVLFELQQAVDSYPFPMNTNDIPGVETEIDRNSPNCFRSRLEVASNDLTIGN